MTNERWKRTDRDQATTAATLQRIRELELSALIKFCKYYLVVEAEAPVVYSVEWTYDRDEHGDKINKRREVVPLGALRYAPVSRITKPLLERAWQEYKDWTDAHT